MGEGLLKVLYAGEDETVELNAEGDLNMKDANGKASTHKFEVSEPVPNDTAAQIKELE